MQLRDFRLERYFATHEFKAKHLLSASDCESHSLAELLALADPETRARWDSLQLGYTESQGHPVLRAEVAAQYRRIGPDDVVIAAPEEAIFIALHGLLAAGDEVVVTWPAYQSLYEVATALGASIVRWPLAVGDGAWQLDLNMLPGLISPRTRALVVNFPHNPTGFLPTSGEFDAILTIAARHGLYVFSDEMYRLLEQNPAERLPAACDQYERGISLSGLSKAFGLPGLRIGWLATQVPGLISRFLRLKDYTTICSSAPSEILAIAALRAAKTILARNCSIVGSNLQAADLFFAGHTALFEWLRPIAGSVAFPRLDASVSVSQLSTTLLAKRNTMLVPGELFEYGGNHFRLGLGRRDFPKALGVMAEFLATERVGRSG